MNKKDLLINKISIHEEAIHLNGSKSYANRALLISSISKGTSVLKNIPDCDDVKYMIDCLITSGVKIEKNENNLTVYGNNGLFNKIKKNELFCGIAGTTSRFVIALSCLMRQKILINGEKKLLERPFGDLLQTISQFNIDINCLKKDGLLPVEINSENLKKVENIFIKGSISSQYLSGILMIAPRIGYDFKINVTDKQVSKSYIDITLYIMRKFGVLVENDNYKSYYIKNTEYKSTNLKIESDWSGASYFLGISALNNVKIKLNFLNSKSIQGDVKLIEIFEKIGCKIEIGEDFITCFGVENLKPIEVNMEEMPDTSITIACICAFIDGISKITGLSTLKNKETNRLLAIHNELLKIGIKTEIGDDFIIIYGNSSLRLSKIITIDTYDDHRIAMCFGMVASKIGNIIIKDFNVVNKSMPEFWNLMKFIGVNFDLC